MDKLLAIAKGLNRRFPDGNHPYQILARLLEECGELAQQVNHFEGAGVELQKHGAPDKAHLVKEVQDVITCALQIMLHYEAEAEYYTSIEARGQRMKQEGLFES
jgi:NTP pyrophosphatase (non-canonical NTP hydrolase)